MTANIMKRPHFTSSCWEFTCSECLEEQPANSLMMEVWRPAGEPLIRQHKATLCEKCGKKLLETT
jgi:hypothetical protein